MRHLLFGLLPLLLSACLVPVEVEVPPPSSQPVLQDGQYEVHLVGVDSLSCAGLRPRDLVGSEVEVSLKAHGSKVHLSFEGMQLQGEMAGGNLSASGQMGLSVGMEDSGTTTVDTGDVSEGNTGGGSAGDTGGASSGGGSAGDTGGQADPSVPCDTGGSSESVAVSLELEIRSDRVADGAMHYEVSGSGMECSFDAQVSMSFVGKGGGIPTPVEETEVMDTGASL
jgi:hypothetical protein